MEEKKNYIVGKKYFMDKHLNFDGRDVFVFIIMNLVV